MLIEWGVEKEFPFCRSCHITASSSIHFQMFAGEEKEEMKIWKRKERKIVLMLGTPVKLSVTIQIDNRITGYSIIYLLRLLSPTDLTTETSLDRRDGTPWATWVTSNKVQSVFTLIKFGIWAAARFAGNIFDWGETRPSVSLSQKQGTKTTK